MIRFLRHLVAAFTREQSQNYVRLIKEFSIQPE